MPIQGAFPSTCYVDTYGVVVADVIDRDLNIDFDIFFKLRHLLTYKKNWSSEKEIGRSLNYKQTKEIENE